MSEGTDADADDERSGRQIGYCHRRRGIGCCTIVRELVNESEEPKYDRRRKIRMQSRAAEDDVVGGLKAVLEEAPSAKCRLKR